MPIETPRDWNDEFRQYLHDTKDELIKSMAIPAERIPAANDQVDALAMLFAQVETWACPGCVFVKEEW